MYHNYCQVFMRWLPEGRNCSCVWSFWCSELCSVDQTVTVQRGSVLDVKGSRVILPALLLPLDEYSSWRVGRVAPMIRSAVRTTLRSLLCSDLVAELNQNIYWCAEDGFNDGRVYFFSSFCGRLNFLSWRRKYNLSWAIFTMESMWLSHFRSWEMVVPRNLNNSTAVTVLFMMVYGGEQGGFSYDHLHCFEHVQLQVVKTAPDSQLLNLLSVSRLVTVLDEADQCGVVCKL